MTPPHSTVSGQVDDHWRLRTSPPDVATPPPERTRSPRRGLRRRNAVPRSPPFDGIVRIRTTEGWISGHQSSSRRNASVAPFPTVPDSPRFRHPARHINNRPSDGATVAIRGKYFRLRLARRCRSIDGIHCFLAARWCPGCQQAADRGMRQAHTVMINSAGVGCV